MSEGFGEILRKYRKASGLSQKKLAERLTDAGYEVANKSTICKWETSKNQPPPSAIELLEEILSVPPGVLQGAAGHAIPEASSVSKAKAEHVDHLVEIIAELLADGVDTVTKVEPSVLPGQVLPEDWAKAESWVKLHGRWQPLRSRRQLHDLLNQKWEFMKHHYKKSDLNGLMYHVAAEFPDFEPDDTGFKYLGAFVTLSLKDPYELIRKLIDLTNTKAFKKTCPDCPQ
jgi:transcriptional regulator with XRE-family HTH domain